MKKCILLSGFILVAVCIRAQSLSPVVIASTGGYASSASGSVSFTSGETATITLNNGVHILTQGFQQPYKDVSASISETPSWDATVYPNPASDVLNVSIHATTEASYSWTIYDMHGASVSVSSAPWQAMGETTFQIPVYELAAGTYLLQVNAGTSLPYTVRFIKH